MHLRTQDNQNVKGDPVAQLMSIYQQNNGEALQNKYQRKQYKLYFWTLALIFSKKGGTDFQDAKAPLKSITQNLTFIYVLH